MTIFCKAVLPLLLAGMLLGCKDAGPENSNTFEVDTGSGAVISRTERSSSGTVTFRRGSGSDVSIPAGFTAYPGATIVQSGTVDAPDRNIVVVEMESADAPAALANYYAGEAEKAGIGAVTRFSNADQELLSGAGADIEFAFSAIRADVESDEAEEDAGGTDSAPQDDGPPITRATLTITQ